jgi:hypothetical protein
MTVLAPEPLSTPQSFDPGQAQRRFEDALPRINKVISFRPRHLRGEKKEEDSAEAPALTWKSYLRLCENCRDPLPFIAKIAEFGARHVNRGGRLAGYQTRRDVMSRCAKHRSGHTVQSIVPKEDGELAPGDAGAPGDHLRLHPRRLADVLLQFRLVTALPGPDGGLGGLHETLDVGAGQRRCLFHPRLDAPAGVSPGGPGRPP